MGNGNEKRNIRQGNRKWKWEKEMGYENAKGKMGKENEKVEWKWEMIKQTGKEMAK